MNILLAFIAFNVIVIVHELGHFIAAKKLGIKVLEFSLFIGPKLYSIQKGETTYSIRLLPIIAYVKMEGEEEASDSARAFNNQPKYARALTAFAGPFANLLLAVILMTVVISLQGFSSTGVQKVGDNSPAASAGIRQGDTILSYDGKRVYMYLDVMQFLYISKGTPAVVEYARDGEKFTKTIIPSKIPEQTTYLLGVSFSTEKGGDSNVIKSVMPGYPAESVGLLAGDRIIKLNNMEITSRDDIVAVMSNNKDKEIEVTVLRSGSEVQASIIPKVEKIPEQYELGIQFLVTKGSLWYSFKQSMVFAYSIVRSVGYSLVWLVQGKAALNQMMGPIGMVNTISTAVQQGPDLLAKVILLLSWTSLLSIALGATNLVPFPMLDGNRLLLIGIEAVRRKPIKPESEAFISMVGFVFLILLAIYAGYNDIVRWIKG
jgi:regulator of sigma E protease